MIGRRPGCSLSTASVSAPSAGTAEPSGGVMTSSNRNGVAVTVNSPAGSATVRNTPLVLRCSSARIEAMVWYRAAGTPAASISASASSAVRLAAQSQTSWCSSSQCRVRAFTSTNLGSVPRPGWPRARATARQFRSLTMVRMMKPSAVGTGRWLGRISRSPASSACIS